MAAPFLIFGLTTFFVANTYYDGKYIQIMKSWKKYYQMAGIGFVGLSAYIFMRKYPSHSRNLLTHANGMIKYLPIDREASMMLTPLLGMAAGSYPMNGGMAQQEQRILNSGRTPDRGNNANGTATKNANVKRSVSETKKKYVAAQQGWNCGACKKQLPAWFEVDHKIRLDNGGSNNVDNLVALCRDCHGKKTAFENL